METSALAVIWNPTKVERDDLAAALAEAGHAGGVGWYETSESDAGCSAAAAALDAGARAVIAAGGDGTVRAVIQELAGRGEVPLGIVPSGTGNLLARNLNIPVNDMLAACRVALAGVLRPIDVGWAEVDGTRHAFVVIAGFGIDSRMIAETDDDLKSKAGWLAYVAALGRAVSSAGLVDVTLSVDGRAADHVRVHTIMIGNCGAVPGGLTLLPDAVPDDGELDALMLSADSLGGWLDTLKTAVWDNGVVRWFKKDPEAVSSASTDHFRGVRFDLVMDKPVTFEVDGDELGDISAVTFEVQPGAVAVRVPES